MIGLLLSALNPFKMILFWGLKKIPLLLEIPTLKDHLREHGLDTWVANTVWIFDTVGIRCDKSD